MLHDEQGRQQIEGLKTKRKVAQEDKERCHCGKEAAGEQAVPAGSSGSEGGPSYPALEDGQKLKRTWNDAPGVDPGSPAAKARMRPALQKRPGDLTMAPPDAGGLSLSHLKTMMKNMIERRVRQPTRSSMHSPNKFTGEAARFGLKPGYAINLEAQKPDGSY